MLKQVISKGVALIVRAAPILLTAAATAGVVGVGYYSAKAAPKAKQALEEAEEEKGEELTTTEKVKAAGKYYGMPVVVGAGTIACMVLACVIGEKQIRALTAAGVATAGAFAKYREQVIQDHGQEYDKEVMEKVVKEPNEIGDEVWFYEPYSKQFVKMSRLDFVTKALELEQKYQKHGHIDMYEYLRKLGIKANPFSAGYVITAEGDYEWEGYSILGMSYSPLTGMTPPGYAGESVYQIVLPNCFWKVESSYTGSIDPIYDIDPDVFDPSEIL